jgi:SAM-dependent methyltransferase
MICPICACSEAREIPCSRRYTAGWPIHVCVGCGLVHVRERRGAEAIARVWSDELFADSPDPKSVLYQATLPAVLARLTYVAETIDQYIGLEGRAVIDIGAGTGVFLDLAKARGARTFGIEPSAANCARLRGQGHDCHEGTVESYAAGGGADLVTILWTLENTSDPRAMLAAAHRVLADDGRLCVATGSRILVPFKKPLDYYLGEGNPDIHPFHWSAATLAAILAVAGFRVTWTNSYIDSDVLCVIAAKGAADWAGDHPDAVLAFFDRWDKETTHYA